jgi:predicted kinase
MPHLVIIRGLPGSGKSTLAKHYKVSGYSHFETDMYFMQGGKYMFDPKLLPRAHKWCQSMVRAALEKGEDVVVSNTFTQKWEVAPYLKIAEDIGARVEIKTTTGQFQSVHGVPTAAIERMRARWEEF